jgi:hypothetical protein
VVANRVVRVNAPTEAAMAAFAKVRALWVLCDRAEYSQIPLA